MSTDVFVTPWSRSPKSGRAVTRAAVFGRPLLAVRPGTATPPPGTADTDACGVPGAPVAVGAALDPALGVALAPGVPRPTCEPSDRDWCLFCSKRTWPTDRIAASSTVALATT